MGVAMWLGAVGCGSRPEANEGPPVEAPPEEEVTPIDVEPSPGQGASRGPEEVPPRPLTEEEEVPPPPPPQEAHCPAPDLGRMPSEGLLEDRPLATFCELTPDACDALRPAHARRAIPRPCRVWNTTPYSTQDYRFEYDALGRLHSFDTSSDWYVGYDYDACHRLVGRSETPPMSMANYDDVYARAGDGQLLRLKHWYFNALTDTVLEHDAQGLLLGATTTWSYSGSSTTTLTQRYTLDAQGRILSAEGTDPKKGLQWREARRYDAAEALEEVVRRAPDGTLQWLKGFSEGRLVRSIGPNASTEKRWTYSPDGVLLRIETLPLEGTSASLAASQRTEYQYGDDGRLLRILRTERGTQDGASVETASVSEFQYAEDGRILLREDRQGPNIKVTTYQYDYVCAPSAR
ncbi:hypothetical protein D7W79_29135 [Corallococcus exercitus]|nr:hypothetical protein D7W79_29135 [Corallococcus exercitus]